MPVELERLLGVCASRFVLSLQRGEHTQGFERARAEKAGGLLRRSEAALDPAAAGTEVAARHPETPQRHGEPKDLLARACVVERVQRGAEIVELGCDLIEGVDALFPSA
ncbi:MAG: hypothetical protein WKF65_13130 [Gaiellaceae bacterium]